MIVHEDEAILLLDGVQVANIIPHFNARGSGGIVVANGYRNIVYFKHYNITAINKSKFDFSSCRSHQRTGEYKSYIFLFEL